MQIKLLLDSLVLITYINGASIKRCSFGRLVWSNNSLNHLHKRCINQTPGFFVTKNLKSLNHLHKRCINQTGMVLEWLFYASLNHLHKRCINQTCISKPFVANSVVLITYINGASIKLFQACTTLQKERVLITYINGASIKLF